MRGPTGPRVKVNTWDDLNAARPDPQYPAQPTDSAGGSCGRPGRRSKVGLTSRGGLTMTSLIDHYPRVRGLHPARRRHQARPVGCAHAVQRLGRPHARGPRPRRAAWVPPLLGGETIEQVGDRFSGRPARRRPAGLLGAGAQGGPRGGVRARAPWPAASTCRTATSRRRPTSGRSRRTPSSTPGTSPGPSGSGSGSTPRSSTPSPTSWRRRPRAGAARAPSVRPSTSARTPTRRPSCSP